MTEFTNKDRAARGQHAIETFRLVSGGDIEQCEAISFLISDLCHLAVQYGQDPREQLQRGFEHYDYERDEEAGITSTNARILEKRRCELCFAIEGEPHHVAVVDWSTYSLMDRWKVKLNTINVEGKPTLLCILCEHGIRDLALRGRTLSDYAPVPDEPGD